MKNKKTLIIVLVLFAILLLSYFLLMRETNNKFNWEENYETESKQPYGTNVIKELLRSYHPNKKFELLKNSITKKNASKYDSIYSNYVFIGNNLNIDSIEVEGLLEFVKSGNNAFISSKSIPDELMSKLYDNECGEWEGYFNYSDSAVTMNFYDTTFKSKKGYLFNYQYKNINYKYDWGCVDGKYFCDSLYSFSALGYIDSFYVNYIQVPFGKGNFLLHTSPMVFTNIELLKKENLEYTGKVFSYLNDGDIYWDEYHKSKELLNNGYSGLGESPLRFIISQKALKWSWYLILTLVVLYILFHVKRKQRIIPLVETNTNTSLEFVKTISRLYYQQSDHKKICRHKMKLFLIFIRNRYYLQTNNLDDELKQKICDKSELPYSSIEEIFKGFKLANYTIVELSENELIEFHQSLDYFYKNCK